MDSFEPVRRWRSKITQDLSGLQLRQRPSSGVGEGLKFLDPLAGQKSLSPSILAAADRHPCTTRSGIWYLPHTSQRRRLYKLARLGMALVVIPISARAGSVPAPVDMATPPWTALGRVQTELGARCTGFLIAPRVVMTAAHCLFRQVTGHYIQPSSIHFLWRYDAGAYADHARAIAFAVAPGYDPRRELLTLGLDHAFLTLDHPVGTAADDVAFAPAIPAVGTPLLLGGYNRDHDEVLEADTCRLRGFAVDHGGHRLLVHDCHGEPGTSGAALFSEQPDGHWRVVGLEVAITGPGGHIGLAEPLMR